MGINYTEQTIHENVWALYKAFGVPGTLMWHTPNGEKRSHKTARKLSRMGVVAGVPDFCCIANSRVFFLELKNAKGRHSPAQKDFFASATEHGIHVFTARSVIEAAEILQQWGVLQEKVKFI